MTILRLLFLVNRDIHDPLAAGGEIHLYKLASILSERGNSVTYVCRRYSHSKKEEKVGNLKVVRLSSFLFSLRVLLYYLRFARNHFDFVVEQVFGGYRLPFMCALYVKEPLVAVWYQRHTKIYYTQFFWPFAALLSIFERGIALFYKKTRILTDSNDQKRELIQLGLPPKKMVVIPPGPFFSKLEGESFQSIEFTPLKVNRRTLLTLGKLRKYKCYHHAILAIQHLLPLHPWLKLVIAGKREELKYEKYLSQIIKTLALENNVEIRLNVSEAEKTELLQNAYALILPSPVEGFGMVALEANMVGTPVIASDGVPHDAVQDNYNGLRYSFGDLKGMAKTIDKLLADKILWKRLSANAVEHVRKFSWEKIVDAFEDFLQANLKK